MATKKPRQFGGAFSCAESVQVGGVNQNLATQLSMLKLPFLASIVDQIDRHAFAFGGLLDCEGLLFAVAHHRMSQR